MTTVPAYVAVAIESPRRPDADRKRDAGRKPAEVFAFFGIKPGDRVADIMCGGGYCVGVLAEIVGPQGKVFAHNSLASLARRKGVNPVAERLEESNYANVETLVSDPGAIVLPNNLDAAIMVMTYHDTVWTNVDRAAMNAMIFAALKPGGIFGVIDHNARPGRGLDDCHECHRIEKKALIAEVTAAGFVVEDESSVLENDEDPCDAGPFAKGKRDHTSRFMVKFRKPA